jgi:hypothetical protein
VGRRWCRASWGREDGTVRPRPWTALR